MADLGTQLIALINCVAVVGMIGRSYEDLDRAWVMPYDAGRYGLVDKIHREVIPPQYSFIDYVGYGIFFCRSINAKDLFTRGEDRVLFTRNGLPIKTKVPPGCKFIQVLWFGKEVDKNPEVQLTDLPPDSLLRYQEKGMYGVCDVNGTVVLKANYQFIGKATEKKAFAIGGEPVASRPPAFIFDCEKRTVEPVENIFAAGLRDSYFSDGLAVTGPQTKPELAGYIDSRGRRVLCGKFYSYGPFVQGLATCETNSDLGKPRIKVVINKKGEIVSPPGFYMGEFKDGFVTAKDPTTGLVGIMDRNFKFVVQPQYVHLSPISPYTNAIFEHTITAAKAGGQEQNTTYYIANKKDSKNQELITPLGKVLVTLSDGQHIDHIEPDGAVRVYDVHGAVKPHTFRVVYMDLQGRVVEMPEKALADGHDRLQAITIDRYLKIVKGDDDRFNSDYWKSIREQPISRATMFGRFLRDYNLIGMDRKMLVQLLGDGSYPNDPAYEKQARQQLLPALSTEIFRYMLTSGYCLSDRATCIIVRLNNGIVTSWHTEGDGKVGLLRENNVVLESFRSLWGTEAFDIDKVKSK